MPFAESLEGQTHYVGDGCKPPHTMPSLLKKCPSCKQQTYVVSVFGDICSSCLYSPPKEPGLPMNLQCEDHVYFHKGCKGCKKAKNMSKKTKEPQPEPPACCMCHESLLIESVWQAKVGLLIGCCVNPKCPNFSLLCLPEERICNL